MGLIMINTLGTFPRSELQKLSGLVDFVDLVKEIHTAVSPPATKSHLSLDVLGNLIEQAYYSSQFAEEGRYPVYDIVAYARCDYNDELRTAVRFDPDVFEEIRRQAFDEGVSFSEQVRKLVRLGLLHGDAVK